MNLEYDTYLAPSSKRLIHPLYVKNLSSLPHSGHTAFEHKLDHLNLSSLSEGRGSKGSHSLKKPLNIYVNLITSLDRLFLREFSNISHPLSNWENVFNLVTYTLWPIHCCGSYLDPLVLKMNGDGKRAPNSSQTGKMLNIPYIEYLLQDALPINCLSKYLKSILKEKHQRLVFL